MIKLTIITINYNNAQGLKRTMESVLNQTSKDFEYIVVDGTTSPPTPLLEERGEAPQLPNISPQPSKVGTGEDAEVLKSCVNEELVTEDGFTHCIWKSANGNIAGGFFSEPDKGIYQAMNKGIRMAQGEYVQFLNSGDSLVAPDVTERMLACVFPSLQELSFQSISPIGESTRRGIEVGEVGVRFSILYGNMLKQLPNRILRDRGFAGRQPTMLDFYTGTLNHSPAYIQRSLFEHYGLYDESLKIVADWKWYVQVIALHGIKPAYTDIDVTRFDMNGISTVNRALDKAERKQVLAELLPASVLADYERWSFAIDQMKRINRYWLARKSFWLVERVLFKWEKWFRNKEQIF